MSEHEPAAPPRILVVEDDEGLNYQIQKTLQREGFEVEGAGKGKEALARVLEDPNMLLLVDYLLPDISGKELVKALKGKDCPAQFIFMSGHGNEKLAVEVMKMGARDYLTKDVGFLHFLPQVVKQVVGELETERRLAETQESLREQSQFIETLVNLSPDFQYIYDITETRNVYVNDGVQKIVGYSAEEIREMGNKIIPLLMHPDDFKAYLEEDVPRYLTAKDNEHILHQYRMKHKDGQWHWFEFREIIYLRQADGSPKQIFGVGRDITDQKRAEEALEESEEKYRSLTEDVIDTSSVGLFILDKDFKVVWVNQALETFFGVDRDDMIGKDKRQLIHDGIKHIFEDPDRFENKVIATYDNNTYVENFECHVLPDGKCKDRVLEHRSSPITSGLYAGGRIEHYMDITERKKAGESLRKSEERLSGFMNSASDSFYLLDSELNFLEINRKGLEIVGKSREEIIGKHITEIVPDVKRSGRYEKHLEVMRTGTPFVIEHFVPHPRFGDRHFILKSFKVGEGLGVIATDITELKRAEEGRRRSGEKYRGLFEDALDMIHIVDRKGRIIDANRIELETMGYTKEEYIGKPLLDIVHPDHRERVKVSLGGVMKGKEVRGFETVLLTKGGEEIAVEVNAVPDIVNNEVVAARGILRNITERKKTEEALRRARYKAEQYLDLAGVILVAIDTRGRVTLINRKGCELLGYREQDILGKDWFTGFLPRKNVSEMKSVFEKLMEGDVEPVEYYENMVRTATGEERLIAWHNTILKDEKDRIIGTLSSGEDITERKRAEEALRESEEKYRNLVERANDGIIIIQDGLIRYANDRAAEMAGFDIDDMIETPFTRYLHPAELPKVGERYKRRMAGEDVDSIYETVIKHKDGSDMDVELNAGVVSFLGKPADQVFIRDITERKRVEEALWEGEERYRALFEGSTDPILTVDLSDKVIAANPAFEKLFGYTNDELLGKAFPGQEGIDDGLFPTWLEACRSGEGISGYETVRRAKDGTPIPVSISVSPIRDKDGVVNTLSLWYRDISERKKGQEEMEKLAAAVRHSSELVNLGTLDGRMIFLNEAGGRMLGIEPDEVASTQVMEVIPDHLRELVAGELLPTLLRGETWEGDLQYRNLKTGELTDVHATCFTVKDPSTQAPLYLANVSLDITERKKAEQALERSREQYRSLYETALVGLFRSRISDGKILEVNAAAAAMLGYKSGEELLKDDIVLSQHYPEERRAELLRQLREKGEISGFELHWTLPDGRELDISISAKVYPEEDYLEGVAVDITERKKVETALRASKAQLSNAMKIAKLGYWEYDVADDLFTFNDHFYSIFRTTAEEAGGYRMSPEQYARRFLHPDDMPVVAAEMKKAFETTDPNFSRLLEHRIIYADGEVGHISVRYFVVKDDEGRTIKTFGANQDITERKKAEENLRSARERLQFLLSNTTAVIYTSKTSGDYGATFISDNIMAQMGYKPEEFIRDPAFWADRIHPDDRDRVFRELPQLYETGYHLHEYRFLCPDGSYRWMRDELVLIKGEDGSPLEIVGCWVDITEQKKAEEALRESEERFRAIVEGIGDAVFIADPKTRKLVDCNQEALNLTGLSREEILSMGANELHPPDKRKETMEAFEKHAAGASLIMESEVVTRDGRRVPVSINSSLFTIHGQMRVVGVFRDITERKKMEEEKEALEAQLRQSQKLESIGTLASGVAHEVNNPLTGIINYADLIQGRVKDQELKEFAEGIMEEGHRVAKIVKNLLTFARREKEHHSPAYVSDIIEASLSLTRAVLRKDQITLEEDIAEDIPKVKCRSQQIQQVLMNLLTNARDALNRRFEGYDKNKLLKVSVRELERDGASWVRTTVEDHGAGISEDIIHRIFDPFFTTKSRAEGTGLGLSVSYGIIRDHHGELLVESEPGKYTRLHVDLRVDNGWSLETTEPDPGKGAN